MVFTMTNVTFYVKSTGKQLLFKIYEINVIISKLFVEISKLKFKNIHTAFHKTKKLGTNFNGEFSPYTQYQILTPVRWKKNI
jgi:archaellum component FlaG (FlaF/FlaG flagellin family)